jgi:hypothetical protein
MQAELISNPFDTPKESAEYCTQHPGNCTRKGEFDNTKLNNEDDDPTDAGCGQAIEACYHGYMDTLYTERWSRRALIGLRDITTSA